ncbi:hypothetical protein ACSAZL_12585 [Methanosarcina sp. T3]|uniref:hypothetical protein n=1 Tax=Methanosarcina sp. T3 TaxID=3439062 RepID=UPI003F871724
MKLIVSLLMLLVFFAGSAHAQNEENSCENVKIPDVTPGMFECLKEKLQGYGIDVPPGNKGELSDRGITGSFEWDGESNLTLTITRKPFFISCQTVGKEIVRFADECKSL